MKDIEKINRGHSGQNKNKQKHFSKIINISTKTLFCRHRCRRRRRRRRRCVCHGFDRVSVMDRYDAEFLVKTRLKSNQLRFNIEIKSVG